MVYQQQETACYLGSVRMETPRLFPGIRVRGKLAKYQDGVMAKEHF